MARIFLICMRAPSFTCARSRSRSLSVSVSLYLSPRVCLPVSLCVSVCVCHSQMVNLQSKLYISYKLLNSTVMIGPSSQS